MSLLRTRRAAGVALLALLTSLGAGVIAAGPAAAVGTDWYVSPSGDDSANCITPSDACETIAEVLLDRAESNDVVHLASGTYDESGLQIGINLTIVGAADGTSKVAGDGYEIFDVEGGDNVPTVIFENVTISDNAGGDGVYAENAAVNFVDSHVDNNRYGVEAYNAAIQATRSTFAGNGTQDSFGDGLYLDCGAVTADHSTFDGNSGAGIWVDAVECFRRDVSIDAATGADVSLRVDHSTVSNNGAAGVGGYNASIQVWTSTLSGNTGAGLDNRSGSSSQNGAGVAE
ncbi:MAG: hypothetical protein QOH89_2755, partial [Pseudonocardiales bacterium]|nr:hypothetical protein [Pseudonocardiales bacterium]